MTIITTTTGKVEGRERGGIHVFLGVPYAAAPVGPLRFRDPRPVPAWEGVRDATQLGPVFVQRPMRGLVAEVMPLAPNQSFDALSLNVWTPDPGAARLPVLVFIHGGGYYSGTGNDELYDGSAFARDGVVTVAINYRLGADGFLFHADDPDAQESAGNFGIADQLAALRWVRENIEAFGGDPDRVTIAGESAGAMSVGTLLATPAARGLFARAILESGAPDKVASAEVAERISRRFLHHLGDPSLEELQATSTERTLEIQAEMAAELAGPDGLELYGPEAFLQTILFVPTYGTAFLPQNPMSPAAPLAEVDVLIGDNDLETAIFFAILSDEQVQGIASRYMSMILGEERAQAAKAAFDRYGASEREVWTRLDSERQFSLPIRQFASALVDNGNTVFKYRFSEPSAARPELGAHHLLELPYVFDTGGTAQGENLAGELNVQTLAAVRTGWLSFIAKGAPDLPNAIWPQYDAERHIVVFRDGAALGNDYRATSWEDWL